MIANIFRSQPSYEGDLGKCVQVMGQTIAKTLERIESVILYLNCDNEDAVEGLVDLVTYTTGEIKFMVHRIYVMGGRFDRTGPLACLSMFPV